MYKILACVANRYSEPMYVKRRMVGEIHPFHS
jgi:hypothetical protein